MRRFSQSLWRCAEAFRALVTRIQCAALRFDEWRWRARCCFVRIPTGQLLADIRAVLRSRNVTRGSTDVRIGHVALSRYSTDGPWPAARLSPAARPSAPRPSTSPPPVPGKTAPSLPIASVNSLGMIQILFDSPWAI